MLSKPKKENMKEMWHPQKDENGALVSIRRPSTPTLAATWTDPLAIATVIPQGAMPEELHAIRFEAWSAVPGSDAEWAVVDDHHGGGFDEPIFVPHAGKRAAAGVVIEEIDGRVWVVHPSNGFGGYAATFPKGTLINACSMQATAIREAFEETGLQVQITGFLADCVRSQSKTRYYYARRIGGTPADMGWESQAVSLIPLNMLGQFLSHPNDLPLVQALQK